METIQTEPTAETVASQAASKSSPTRSVLSQADDERESTGLFLVQFKVPPGPDERRELESLGIELLRYVPDDAYVARFNKTRKGLIRKLNFVHWVGPYRNEHKIHPRLKADRTKTALETLEVAVLLSPKAADADTVRARQQFQSIRQESGMRAGRVIRGTMTRPQLDELSRSDSVLWIEPSGKMKLYDEVSSKIVAGDGGQNTLLSQALGYDGAGVTVAVADSGLNNGDAATMHPDLLGRTPAFFYYGSLTDASDQHSHGTHCAGIIAGNGALGELDGNGALYGLGVAPGASIIGQRLFGPAGEYEPPDSFKKLTRDATQAGADIGSNSWGEDTQGAYDLSAMEFDLLVRDADVLTQGEQPYVLEFSAGNAGPGPQTIGSPAVGKNVIATGASQNGRLDYFFYGDGIDAMADFSSRGPCEDGRIKPDLVAPGTWIASLFSRSATDAYAWDTISSNYMFQGGTSQAGPQVAGAAAVFIHYYRQNFSGVTPSPAMVKAALINSAADMADPTHTAAVPNNDEGWGRVNLTPILDSGRRYDYVDQTVLMTNGQIFERQVLVSSSDEPFKVTLTYTDVPGFPGAIPALVNDLNLEVVAPDGRSYHGNQFFNGVSVPGAPGWDTLNNVEGVLIPSPLPGSYIVRVHAAKVVEDSRVFDTPAVDDQDFALVSSGRLALTGESIVALDRKAYTAPGLMKLSVIDLDLNGAPSVTVNVSSSWEPAGENVVLTPNGLTGTYTGTVATVTGAAVLDGNLQIAHGDVIEVRYLDVSAGLNRVATAVADLEPPVLTDVGLTNRFGRTYVRWMSDEPADSLARYGTNSALSRIVADSTLVLNHFVPLSGLVTGTNYYFVIVSADEAGNVTTNDNGGGLVEFIAEPPP
ncbi:MAG TPA: S8 family serine peptidase, partial [Verrucomicrobiota bacterium]|nr:S8 family serine peptidase [Verrucomicrobiota bacterium]